MENMIIPGDVVWEREVSASGTYVQGGKTYATVMGMLKEDKFIPLEIAYRPKVGDNVVGMVVDERNAGYAVDLNLPYNGMVPTRKVRIRLELGGMVYGKVTSVDEVGNVDIGEVDKLPAGKMISVPPSKVPRIIGKKSSMLNQIREKTGCSVFVGNNGYIWIGQRGNVPLVLKTVKLIIDKAHTSGLTDVVADYLEKNR
ncbi:MAG: KH domain-containing protein [Candidatus Micrarchaeota archaeon]